MPGPGVDAYELFRKIDAGEIKGLISICFNPKISLPDNEFIARALEKLEFYVAIDFFLNDTARHADIVLPGSLQEEDEGTVTQVEGRVIKINKAVDCPGEARQDWRIIQDLARRSVGRTGFTFAKSARDLRGAAHRQQGRRRRLLGHHLREDRAQMGVFWPCYSDDPKTGAPRPITRARRDCSSRQLQPGRQGRGPFYFPDGKARFNVADIAPQSTTHPRSIPLFLTTGRVVSQFLSGTQTRRIGPLVKQYPSRGSSCIRGSQRSSGSPTATGRHARPVAARSRCARMVVTTIRPDTVFIPYHWPGDKSPTGSPSPRRIRSARSPSTRCARCRVRRPTHRRLRRRTRAQQQ
jgi:assimilatory nitrate reductase catalytic subunit